MKLKFTVPGSPVPYLRMTQGQLKVMRFPLRKLRSDGLIIRRRIQRYLDYKSAVRLVANRWVYDRAPVRKVFLNVVIYFRDRKHGDPENVRKGIQDAIFDEDKMVAGSVDFFYDPKYPRVEIEIVGAEEVIP